MSWGKTKAQEAMEKEMLDRLIKRGLSKNNDPKNELSRNCRRYLELKSKIETLQAEYDAINSYLKQTVTQRGETLLVPDLKDDNIGYTLVITPAHQTKLDTTKAKALLTEEEIAQCSYTINFENLSIKEVSKVAA